MPANSNTGGSSSGDIKAGGAFVEIFTKNNALYRGLAEAEARLKRFGAFATKIGAGLFGIGGAAAGGLGAILGGGIDRAQGVQRLADKLGVNVEKLQAFAFAAETTGVSLEDLTGHFENFAERIAQGAQGTGEAAKALNRLGLDASQMILKDPIEQMMMLSDALKQVSNDTERLGILSQFGGDQFQWLNTLFRGGSNGIKELMQDAKDVGAVLDDKALRDLANLGREVNFAWAAVKGVFSSIAAAIVPTRDEMRGFRDYVIGASKGIRQFIEANGGLIRVAAVVAGGIAAVGAGLVGLGISASLAGAGIGGIISVASTLLSPMGLLTTALVGGTYAFFEFTEVGRTVFAEIKAGLSDMAQIFSDTFGGIGDAIRAADLGLAGKTAMAGLNAAFKQGQLWITSGWIDFKSFWVDIWQDMLTVVRHLINDWSSWIAKRIADVIGGFGQIAKLIGVDIGLDAGKLKEQIEIDRQQDEKRINDERARKAVEANRFRLEQLDRAQKELDDAKAELDRLKKEAAGKAAQPRGAGAVVTTGSTGGIPPFFLPPASRGLFSGPFSQALGLSDKIPERILSATERTAKAVEGADNKLGALVGGLAFR